ncbi:MAG: lysophospholipase [Bacteroidales bacterium]|nr:lysophospholipase [Lachnoclostridium sp.]MCM1385526.1 lysophospholipase [Lachnoclostridium sp.]MCM1466303.1 lysophospholipase [Bacteroidales bacterium]
MKKEEFYFDSCDGEHKLHGVRYIPEQGEVTCVLQIVHGMAEYVERYEEFAKFLTDRGVVVTGEDHLGHGKSVDANGIYGYFCKHDPATVVVKDVHRLRKLTQKLYPKVPYVILGHSMGSFILRNYLCCYGAGISGAVIMGTGMPASALVKLSKIIARMQRIVCGERHISKFLDKAVFGNYNKGIAEPRTDFDWLSRNGASVDAYIKDPLCGFVFTANGFYTLFELITRVQKKRNLEKVPKTLPLLMLSGTADPVGEYGQGVRRAYRSFREVGVNDIKLKLYRKGRHELLNETNKNVVMQDIYDWMQDAVLLSRIQRSIIADLHRTMGQQEQEVEEQDE